MRITENDVLYDLSRTTDNAALTIRARAAYDLYFGRVFCVGGFVEYRWLKFHVPEYSLTVDRFFRDVNDSSVNVTRITEMTMAGRTFDMGGFACGVRLGLRL